MAGLGDGGVGFGGGKGDGGGGGGAIETVEVVGLGFPIGPSYVGAAKLNSYAHWSSLSSSSGSSGSVSPVSSGTVSVPGLPVGSGSLTGVGVGRDGGFGFSGSGKSLPPSVQSNRHGWLQNIRHGLPQPDLHIGPGRPGLKVTIGKMAALLLLEIEVGWSFAGWVNV